MALLTAFLGRLIRVIEGSVGGFISGRRLDLEIVC